MLTFTDDEFSARSRTRPASSPSGRPSPSPTSTRTSASRSRGSRPARSSRTRTPCAASSTRSRRAAARGHLSGTTGRPRRSSRPVRAFRHKSVICAASTNWGRGPMSRLDVVVDRLASGAAVVRLAGEFEHEYAYTLDVQLQKVEAETDTLVIDMRGLHFMDSAGLGRLLAARRRAARAGRRLVDRPRRAASVDRVMMLAGPPGRLRDWSPTIPPDLTAPPSAPRRDTGRVSAARPPIDERLARRLVDAQFPQWAGPADRARRRWAAWTTARSGSATTLSVRLPSADWYALQVEKEQRWLPVLAPLLPAPDPRAGRARRARARAIPTPGRSTAGSRASPPAPRAVRGPGRRSPPTSPASSPRCARADADGGPGPGPHNFHRGGPLAHYEAETLEAIAALGGAIDGRRARGPAGTRRSRPPGTAPPVWFHGDVRPEQPARPRRPPRRGDRLRHVRRRRSRPATS